MTTLKKTGTPESKIFAIDAGISRAAAEDNWTAWALAGIPDLLSIIIPAYNEEAVIGKTLTALQFELDTNQLNYEIIVVNDSSNDRTREVVMEFVARSPGRVRLVDNSQPNGYGRAVRKGLRVFRGDAAVITMADLSDSPSDIVLFYKKLKEGHDCVFGSRFVKGATIVGYPRFKLIVNRIANFFIQIMTLSRYNDFTNGFKCYRRYVVAAMQPLVSNDFNLTIEMSLKATFRNYEYAVLPNAWVDRSGGRSSFKIGALFPRYTFTLFYCLIERVFLGRNPGRNRAALSANQAVNLQQ